MHIAIIGMGGSGISVLREWTRLRQHNPDIRLTVYGNARTFGTGLPYQLDDASILLNQPAEWMSIIPERPLDFVEWLQDCHGVATPMGKYYPRSFFGEYMQDRMHHWLTLSKATIVTEDVLTVRLQSDKRYTVTTEQTQESVDAVHVCIGHLPLKDPYGLKENGRASYIHTPYPIQDTMSTLPQNAKVGVLGTGLTAMDLLRYHHFKRPDLRLSFYSRTGEFKSIRAKSLPPDTLLEHVTAMPSLPTEKTRFSSLEEYADWATRQGEKMGFSLPKVWKNHAHGTLDTLQEERDGDEELNKLHLFMHQMDASLVNMWTALPVSEKKAFLDTHLRSWDRLRSPYPYASGHLLVRLWEEETIQVYKGLTRIDKTETGFHLFVDNNETQTEEYLINAMGSMRIEASTDSVHPLVDQLLEEELVQPDTWGGVQVMWPSLSTVTQRYGVLETLKIHGQLISGVQFGNNGILAVSDSAAKAVSHLYGYLKQPNLTRG